jgi:Icc-related predicted phosphoesterase
MKICHLSDSHGQLGILPQADLYLVTGDMLPNYPLLRVLKDSMSPDGIVTIDPLDQEAITKLPRNSQVICREVNEQREIKLQNEWINQNPFRKLTGLSESAPVVTVRGNHDFVGLKNWIGANVWEVDLDSTQTVSMLGLKIGGVRGINYMMGEWSDELSREEFDKRVEQLPFDIDILISHSPAFGILDSTERYGSPSLASWINKRLHQKNKFTGHFFGHVHESHGVRELGGALFSNAATTVHLFNLER